MKIAITAAEIDLEGSKLTIRLPNGRTMWLEQGDGGMIYMDISGINGPDNYIIRVDKTYRDKDSQR